jgi:hypothetical protein
MWEPVKYLLAGIGGIAAFSLVAQFLTWNALLDQEKMEADAKRHNMEMEQIRASMSTRFDADACETLGPSSPPCLDGLSDD